MRYVQGKLNGVADVLSRLPANIKTSEIHAYEPPEHLKDEEFILAVTEPVDDSNTDKLITDCEGKIMFGPPAEYSTAQQKTTGKIYMN